ncbi:hypothetical protein HYU10_03330 [Candidatus Woesearchaeota archaeon]|nr:hypothetical protein [Candidatus Woesearchaeota archaeon]
MMENKNSGNAVEKAIFALIVIVGIGMIYNQTRMISVSSTCFHSSLSLR